MNQWIRENFEIIPNGWVNIDGTLTDAFTFMNGEQPVKSSVAWFSVTFGSVAIPPTAETLKAVDPDDLMGWHTHFDAWKAQGIIS